MNGTYAAVKFSDRCVADIVAIQESLNLAYPVSPDKLHSTVVYSKGKEIPFVPLSVEKILATKAWLEVFNTHDSNVLVLRFDSEYLQSRHDYGTILGANYDFDEYLPHITLSYDVGAVTYEGVYDINIEMNYEYTEAIHKPLTEATHDNERIYI
ncbi:hypothetical protein TH1_186 [Shewanella phage Thanatos-1]|nr:hypothetical protein TH1_186 [Shewanella phage Thanatos-1]